MIPTSIVATVAAAPAVKAIGARRIFANAQARIDHIWASSLPVDLKYECGWDVILQAGRDLDRLAAHTRLIMRLEPKVGAR